MNKILLFLLCTTVSCLEAQIGCMDTSMHLSQSFDTKQLHYVGCNCPCDRYYTTYESKGCYCMKCKHARIPKEWIIVQSTNYTPMPVAKRQRPLMPLVRQFRKSHEKRNNGIRVK